jgi:hypothetical protein
VFLCPRGAVDSSFAFYATPHCCNQLRCRLKCGFNYSPCYSIENGWMIFFILAGRERALRGLSCGDEFSENDKELLVVVVRDKIMFALWLLFVRWRAEPWKGEFAKCVARLFLELRLRGVQRD